MTILERPGFSPQEAAYSIVRSNQIINELISKARGDVPNEILALMARILIDENATRVPAVHYRRSRKTYSTGRCYGNSHIVLTVGRIGVPTEWIAIHELAHWLSFGEHHSPFFCERAFELYDRYRDDVSSIMNWEFSYKSYAAKLGYALFMRSIKGVRWSFADEVSK